MISDVLSQTHLPSLPQIAVILLTAAFIAIVVRVWRSEKRYEGLDQIPLNDEPQANLKEKS